MYENIDTNCPNCKVGIVLFNKRATDENMKATFVCSCGKGYRVTNKGLRLHFEEFVPKEQVHEMSDFAKVSYELDAVNELLDRYKAAYLYLLDKAAPTDIVEAQRILGEQDEQEQDSDPGW